LDRLLGVCVSFCACRLAMTVVQTHAIFPEHAARVCVCVCVCEREREVLACRIWTSHPRNSRPSLDSDLVLMSFFFSNTNLLCSNPQILLYPQTACVFKRTATHMTGTHRERRVAYSGVHAQLHEIKSDPHRDSEMDEWIISFFSGVQRSITVHAYLYHQYY